VKVNSIRQLNFRFHISTQLMFKKWNIFTCFSSFWLIMIVIRLKNRNNNCGKCNYKTNLQGNSWAAGCCFPAPRMLPFLTVNLCGKLQVRLERWTLSFSSCLNLGHLKNELTHTRTHKNTRSGKSKNKNNNPVKGQASVFPATSSKQDRKRKPAVPQM